MSNNVNRMNDMQRKCEIICLMIIYKLFNHLDIFLLPTSKDNKPEKKIKLKACCLRNSRSYLEHTGVLFGVLSFGKFYGDWRFDKKWQVEQLKLLK